MRPLVSVIMNCYNGEKYLREAIDSIVGQTYQNWEIVFWDNQSSDKSADIFKSYQDKRFRYFFAPTHTTLGQARNLAVEKASGEWVAFLDCDDMWFPEKLVKQVNIIQEEGPELGLVYGRTQILVEKDGLNSRWGRDMQRHEERGGEDSFPEGNVFPKLLKKNFIPMLSAIVRRLAYWSVGGIEPTFKLSEDHDLFVKISKDYEVRAVQEIVCVYRVHSSNESNEATFDLYQESLKIVSRYLPLNEAKVGIRHQSTYFAIEEIRRGFLIKGLRRLLIDGDLLLFIYKAISLVCCKIRLLNNL